jgi:hypothetical protein
MRGVHDARDEIADLQRLLGAAGILPPMCWSVTPTAGCSRACSPVSTRRRRPASCWSTPAGATRHGASWRSGRGRRPRRLVAPCSSACNLVSTSPPAKRSPATYEAWATRPGSRWATEVNPPGRRGSPGPSVATSSGHQQRERAPDQRSAGGSRCRCRARAVRAFWMHAGVSAAAEQTPARDDERACPLGRATRSLRTSGERGHQRRHHACFGLRSRSASSTWCEVPESAVAHRWLRRLSFRGRRISTIASGRTAPAAHVPAAMARRRHGGR